MRIDELDDFIIEIMKKRVIDPYHDIPYLAGYNKDGTIIYIDKDCPYFFKGFPIYQLLIIHEHVEKNEIDKGVHYQAAHQTALITEKIACTSLGLSWNEYDLYMKKKIKTAAHEQLENVPDDLDFTPYLDEHDYEELKRMFSSKRVH